MATETSSIDDLLTGSMEHAGGKVELLSEDAPENDYDNSLDDANDDVMEVEPETHNEETETEEEDEDNHPEKSFDEYGNEKPAPRTYTEDEVNERINKAIRERLARGNHQANQQPTQKQIEQQAKDFEYDPDAEGNWQQQLEQFVEKTFEKMTQKQIAQQQAIKEQQAEIEFRERFTQGMDRFDDFYDTVSAQPVTDAMTLALRGVKDPAAFIYAASKRHPAELQRISQLKDPYSQIVEMGKLEERMRKAPASTKAPRPLGRTVEDATTQYKKQSKSEPTIEDLISRSEQKRLSMMKQRRGK